MDLGLKGAVAIVTGGASGIGRKTCHTYAQEGVVPVIFDVQNERGRKVEQECRDFGVEAAFLPVDIRDRAQIRSGVNEVFERYGKVDILVHNAAPYTDGSAVMPFLKQTDQIWQDNVNVILWGAVYLTQEVLPRMFERGHGRLIYICSDAGREGDAYQAVYSASKASTVGFMKSMARYGGRKNVLANVVSPALTLTDENEQMLNTAYKANTEEGLRKLTGHYPSGRLSRAQDLANMIVFLTSERCGNVTGQVIGVNGGYFMPSC